MADFQIKDLKFSSKPMDLFKQVHVLRRIGPFVPDMIVVYRGFEKKKQDISTQEFLIDAAIVMGPDVLKTFSLMKDEDAQYVITACLETLQMAQGEMYSNLMVNGRLMFQNIDLFIVSQLVWKVLEDNFRPFFSDLKTLRSGAR